MAMWYHEASADVIVLQNEARDGLLEFHILETQTIVKSHMDEGGSDGPFTVLYLRFEYDLGDPDFLDNLAADMQTASNLQDGVPSHHADAAAAV